MRCPPRRKAAYPEPTARPVNDSSNRLVFEREKSFQPFLGIGRGSRLVNLSRSASRNRGGCPFRTLVAQFRRIDCPFLAGLTGRVPWGKLAFVEVRFGLVYGNSDTMGGSPVAVLDSA